jgi:hypothetical protein
MHVVMHHGRVADTFIRFFWGERLQAMGTDRFPGFREEL